MKIVCPLYGKAHGIMQINQNKCNFPVSAANIVEIKWHDFVIFWLTPMGVSQVTKIVQCID